MGVQRILSRLISLFDGQPIMIARCLVLFRTGIPGKHSKVFVMIL